MEPQIQKLLENHFSQKTSFSIQLPFMRGFFVFIRRLHRKYKNNSLNISRNKEEYKKYINVHHQSVLMRKL
jgi:hypothetical protein